MGGRIRLLLGAIGVVALTTLVLPPAATRAATAPMLSMSWLPDTIAVGQTTTLRLAPFNPDESADIHNIAFTDTLPAGLTVPNGTWTDGICGGTVTVTGNNHIAYALGTLGPTWSCRLDFTVTGTARGTYLNVAGPITANGSGTNDAQATLTVDSPPTFGIGFGATSIGLGNSTPLTFALTNPNATGLTGIGLSDTLPPGIVVATPNGLTGNCDGTVTAVAGTSSVSLAGASLDGAAHCFFTVIVKATSLGLKGNTAGPISSTEGGTGSTASASITVVAQPTLAMAFGAATIGVGSSTSLTFTVTNVDASAARTGIGFADTLPAGLEIASPNGLGGNCGGTIVAAAGGNTIGITGLSLAAGATCSFSVNVKGTSSGTKVNTTGPIFSAESGTGSSATASVAVSGSPTLSVSFNPTTIVRNGTTVLTFTVGNPAGNVAPFTALTFTDTLPAGLTVANGSAAVCGGGGTMTTSGGNTITVTIASLAVGESCTITVTVNGPATDGSFTNTTGSINTAGGVTGLPASATLVVAAPASPTPAPAAPTQAPASAGPTPPSTSSLPAGTPSGSYPLPLLLLGLGLALLVALRCQLRSR